MIENFGLNLSNLRKQKGLSQKELAEEIGLNKQSISEIENGRRYPTFTNLEKIAQFFKATPNQLFGTSQEIELERAVLETDEYTNKAKQIMQSVKAFNDLTYQLEDYNSPENYTSKTINNLYKITHHKPILDPYTEEHLYRHLPTGKLVRAEEKEDSEQNYELAYKPSRLEQSMKILEKISPFLIAEPIMSEDGEQFWRDKNIPNHYILNGEDDPHYEPAYNPSKLEQLLERADEIRELYEKLHYIEQHKNSLD